MPTLNSALSEKSFSVKSSAKSNDKGEPESGNKLRDDGEEDDSEDHENEFIDGLAVNIPFSTDDKETGRNLDKDGNVVKRKRMRKYTPLFYNCHF